MTNLDPNKIIEDLQKATEEIKSAARIVKRTQDYVKNSGVKATAALIPSFDQLLSSLAGCVNAQANSCQSLIQNVERMPFGDLKSPNDNDFDDIFGDLENFSTATSTAETNEDIYDPDNYIQDDIDEVSAIASGMGNRTNPARESQRRVSQQQVLRKYLKPTRENKTYKKGLDMERITDDLEYDNTQSFRFEEDFTRQYMPEAKLEEDTNFNNFLSSSSFERMQENLEKEGISSKIRGGDQFLSSLNKGHFAEAGASVNMGAKLEEKMESNQAISWEELGAVDFNDSLDYGGLGLNI